MQHEIYPEWMQSHPRILVFHGNPTEDQKRVISEMLLHSLKRDMEISGAYPDVFYDRSAQNPTNHTSKDYLADLIDTLGKRGDGGTGEDGHIFAARDYIRGLSIAEWYELKVSALRSLGLQLENPSLDLKEKDPDNWEEAGAHRLIMEVRSRMPRFAEVETIEPGYYIAFNYPGNPDKTQKEWAGTAVKASNEISINSDFTKKEIIIKILERAAEKLSSEETVRGIQSALDYINSLSEEEIKKLERSAIYVMLGFKK